MQSLVFCGCREALAAREDHVGAEEAPRERGEVRRARPVDVVAVDTRVVARGDVLAAQQPQAVHHVHRAPVVDDDAEGEHLALFVLLISLQKPSVNDAACWRHRSGL